MSRVRVNVFGERELVVEYNEETAFVRAIIYKDGSWYEVSWWDDCDAVEPAVTEVLHSFARGELGHAGLIDKLTEEERKALSPGIRAEAETALRIGGLDLDDLSDYAEVSYRLGANPLPVLRNFFAKKEIPLRLEFAYYNPGLCWLPPEEGGPHLIAYLNTETEPHTAWLEWNC